MSLTLYAHPFSSYCWKVLIALYEDATPFSYRKIENDDDWAELSSLWPIKKFPLLIDDGVAIAESSIIIEHLMNRSAAATRWIPRDSVAALRVRFFDRYCDNYVMTPMMKLVGDRLRAEPERDPRGVADARASLDVAYAWLETQLTADGWIVPGAFTLADCAAAPSLFYADWAYPIPVGLTKLRGYRARLLARPSVARVVDEARPYRPFFPLGAPDRD